MKSIRFLALLLCAALLLPLVPVHAAQSGGSFYLTASTAGQTLIEPVAVPYTAGQTIRDALRGSGYAFGGIDTAFITDIEGVAGNFTVYYDGGAYSLDAIASPETVTAVVFSERERGFPALLDAVTELARFRERTDHVQNYPAAQQAYAAALSGLRTADEAGLTTLLAALRSAVAEYETILNGTKYPVTFTDTAGTAAQLTLTDSYGNVTQVQGLRAEVVAGEYTFSLSDGGANRVDGTLTVAGAVESRSRCRRATGSARSASTMRPAHPRVPIPARRMRRPIRHSSAWRTSARWPISMPSAGWMPLRTRRSTAATSARTARTTATAASPRTARAGQAIRRRSCRCSRPG